MTARLRLTSEEAGEAIDLESQSCEEDGRVRKKRDEKTFKRTCEI